MKLASQLLLDAFKDNFEVAAVFTNDSDLAEPIRIVRKELRKTVGVMLTCRYPFRRASQELVRAASFHRLVSDEMLAESQFPESLMDEKGRRIRKPDRW